MKYTIIEAAKILNISRQTLYRHIEKKSISVSVNDSGGQMIDASELIRVYGNDIDFSVRQDAEEKPNKLTAAAVDEKMAFIKLEGERQSLRDKVQYLEEEKAYLRKLLAEEREERQRATALLADLRHLDKNHQETSFQLIQDMEAKIKDQEMLFKSEQLSLRKKLKEEQLRFEREINKSFWQRLFRN